MGTRNTRPAQAARRIITLLTLLAAVASGLVGFSSSPASAAPQAMEFQFLSMLNGHRTSAGLAPLQMSADVSNVAEAWSANMGSQQVLSHNPSVVPQVSQVAPNWQKIGENVGYGPDVPTLDSAFINSAPHKANIMDPAYNYVGIGAVMVGNTIWVTFDFVNSTTPLTVAGGGGTSGLTISLVRSDGVITSSPTVAGVRGSSRLDTFAKGTDDAIYWSSSPGTGFGGWVSLGAPSVGLTGDPVAVSWAPGRLDVFVRGGDNRLWQRWSGNGGASWSGWIQPLGASGVLASAPMVTSWAAGRLDVMVVGTDGHLYQRFYENGWSPWWYDQGTPPSGISGDPGAATWAPGRLDLFVRGGDNRLWQRFWGGSSWSGWFKPVGDNGTLASSPSAASAVAGQLTILTRGTDNGVYAMRWTNSWVGWTRVGDANTLIQNRPMTTASASGVFAVGRGTDNRAYLFSNI